LGRVVFKFVFIVFLLHSKNIGVTHLGEVRGCGGVASLLRHTP
jgi:hypothetical protein